MDEYTKRLVTQAQELSTSERISAMSNMLDKIHKVGAKDDWYTDTLMHLWSELLMDYRLLELSYITGQTHFIIARPSLMAWRTRNLLELSIWIEYCFKDRNYARQFYEDKARDIFDWMSAGQTLASFFPNNSAADEIKASKRRFAAKVAETGIADIDESYTRVAEAARILGHQDAWSPLNKFFSKFAHPTAFTVLTLAQGENEIKMSDTFLAFGCAIFICSIVDFESHLKALAA